MEAHARMIVEATKHLVEPLLQCENSGQCFDPPEVLGDYFTDDMLKCLFHLYGIAPGGRGSEAIVRTLVGVFELSVHGIPRSMSVSRLREIGFVVDVQGLNHCMDRMNQEFGKLNRKIDTLAEIMIRLFPDAAVEIAAVVGRQELGPTSAADHDEIHSNNPTLAAQAVSDGIDRLKTETKQ